jgi:hypothetical protein
VKTLLRYATVLACGAVLALTVASQAHASLFTFTGSGANAGNTATADFTFDAGADKITVILTNTTLTTLDAGDLFTGIRFSVGGLTPTLTSDQGIQRSVANAGTFVDTVSLQNLSWSLNSNGGGFQLDFNPDAKDAIIGPPTSGSYLNANGSIKGNPGHNPFAAQTATFVLSVPGLMDGTPLSVTAFLFGTGPSVATGDITTKNPPVPEPGSLLVFSLLSASSLALLGVRRRL